VLLVLTYEIAPLLTLVVRSFLTPKTGEFTLLHYAAVFQKKLYRDAVLNSLFLSLLSAGIGMTVAFFGAKAADESLPRRRNAFLSILNMTSNFAGVPLAFSYIILLGNAGVLILLGRHFGIEFLESYNLYSFSGLLLVYVYFQIPLGTMLLVPAFQALRPEWREAVSLLGGKAPRYWLRVGLPVLLPSLLGTFSVLFSNAVAAYATAYALLGGNFSLLPIRISEQFVGDVLQKKEFGSALAVVLMVLMVAVTTFSNWLLRRAGQQGGAYGK
jgi:putative spermidine/putrescine transport system permease protein